MPPSDTTQPAVLRRKAHARLAERIDPVRTRHKPISLVRQEARRTTEQFLDTDCPTLTRSERDALVEDVLAEGVGYGLLEELFRDDTVKEIQVLGPGHVAARKADGWQPSAVTFRDADQLRLVATRYSEVGESLGESLGGGFDVRLANGFRAVGVLPPAGVDFPPVLLLIRGAPPAAKSGVVSRPTANDVFGPPPAAGSGVVSFAVPAADAGHLSGQRSGIGGPTSGRLAPRPVPNPPSSPRMPAVGLSQSQAADPYARDRQRVSEYIIRKCAAAGVFDLQAIPLPQLRQFVLAAVSEYASAERLICDEVVKERLALEILASMAR